MPSTEIIFEVNALFSIIISAIILWYFWSKPKRHILELAAKIPGPLSLPIIGNSLDFVIGNPYEIFTYVWQKTSKYKNVLKIWAGSKLIVFLWDPRDAELILSSSVHIDKSSEYNFFKPWLGNGLLISTGQKWKTDRKLIAPTFHLNVLKSFVDLFNVNSRDVVKKLENEVGKEFDCHDYMSEATVEMLMETAMGVSKKAQNQSSGDYAKAVIKMCDILHLRHTKFWLRYDLIFNRTKYAKYQKTLINTIHSFTRKIISQKRNRLGSSAKTPLEPQTKIIDKPESKRIDDGLSYAQSALLTDDLDIDESVLGEKKRIAFLDLMIEASQNGAMINDEEIKEQVDTIMFEGHDTTAAASSFFLSVMGIHQDIQDKVVQELYEIFGDSDRPSTFADTLEMKYLERCLMETLRMFPPVPFIARKLKQHLKLVSGDYIIPAGCTVVIGTFRIHRREEIYPNPNKFDPDNFLPERTANRHYYSFIPFSAGPRSCVGRKYAILKLKILLSTILRNYRVYSNLREEEFQLQGDIILKRAEGFKVKLELKKKLVRKRLNSQ